MEGTIQRLNWNKGPGPDKIPNKIFIKANKKPKELLKLMIENNHTTKDIYQSWEEGKIIKGKDKKENAEIK